MEKIKAIDGKVFIPQGTMTLFNSMFENPEEIYEVFLPSSVKIISENAFSNFENLEKIYLNEGLIGIKNGAFSNCRKMKEIFIPNSVMMIDNVFSGCENLSKIEIGNDNKNYADFGCNAIISKNKKIFYFGCNNSSIPEGVEKIYKGALKNLNIRSIRLPNSLVNLNSIEDCHKLERVFIGENVAEIGSNAFKNCENLQVLKIDNNNPVFEDRGLNACIRKSNNALVRATLNTNIDNTINALEQDAFVALNSLEKLSISKNIVDIANGLKTPKNLRFIEVDKDNKYYGDGHEYSVVGKSKNIIINKEDKTLIKGSLNAEIPPCVTTIGKGAFSNLDLEEFIIPDNITVLDESAFSDNVKLRKIVLSQNLESIDKFAFYNTALEEIIIPKSVTTIATANLFGQNPYLKRIIVDADNPNYTDLGANALVNKRTNTLIALANNAQIPENIENIYAFDIHCDNERLVLPKNLKNINAFAFNLQNKVKEIIFNDKIQMIGSYVFSECASLEKLEIPKTVKAIYANAFLDTNNLKECSFHSTTQIFSDNLNIVSGATVHFTKKSVQLPVISVYAYNKFGMVFMSVNHTAYFDDKYGNLVVISLQELMQKQTPTNKIGKIQLKDLYKLYEWNKYPQVPNYAVVKNMPIEEIPLYYVNNNRKNWQIIVQASKIGNENEDLIKKESLFAIAHALGVFSPNGAESKEATEYIIYDLLTKYEPEELHAMFSGFDVENTPYNAEFAKFFMKNFKDKSFMTYTNDDAERVNLLSACHNGFIKLQAFYPEKKVVTRQDKDRLTEAMAIDFFRCVRYENVNPLAQTLAEYVGSYGYKQEQFETLQEWYLQGLNVKNKITAEPDDANCGVTYEILEKTDALGAVLGDKSHCCQVIGGNGERCLEYGMTQPNSTFIVFRKGKRLVGQAWVWYDENSAQVTLDNIEVPNTVLEDMAKDEQFQKDVIDCLNRMSQNILSSMNKNNYKVEKVTIGLSYNDFLNLLRANYKSFKGAQLSNYTGYTDAKKQLLLASTEPQKVKDNDVEFI